MNRTVFCFPYRGIGGVSLLFARLADILARMPNHEVWIVDYEDGFLTRSVQSPEVHRLHYRDGQQVQLPDESLVVFQSRPDWFMFPGLRFTNSSRLLFWNCQAFNLVPTVPGLRQLTMGDPRVARAILATVLRGYRSRIVRFIRFLEERNAIVFMDEPNVRNTAFCLDLQIPAPRYLPILSGELAVDPLRTSPTSEQDLRICWVGRIADSKHHSLRYSCEQLNRLTPQLGRSVSVTIVGTGPFLTDLKQAAAAWTNMSVTFIDEVAPEELPAFLRQNVDVMLAMGTSALDGARCGIPTILLDVFYAPVPEGYLFTWLHERSGYSVGEIPGPERFEPGNTSLLTLLSTAMADYRNVSTSAVDHYRSHHAPEMVAGRFLDCAASSACSYSDFKDHGFGQPDAFYELFAAARRRAKL